jgi:hypothetical protein
MVRPSAATRTGLLRSRRCAGGERTRGCVYAFDLLELDGKDMRREPYEVRKATLASVLRQGRPGLRINEHWMRRIEDDFLVTGPDIEPMKFNSRREAKDWCRTHYPGSPITEIGANRLKRIVVAAKGRPKWRPENR